MNGDTLVTVIIGRLEDLARFLDTTGADRVVFRGQGDAAWGLVPSMFRGLESSNLDGWEGYIGDRERDIFREFSDQSVQRWSSASPWDILVLAQHYGTPTRLLDWTTNANFALYFAASSSPSMDGAVWCATPSKVPMPSRIGRIHNGLGYRKERLSAFIPERDLPFCMPYSKTSTALLGVSTPTPAPPPPFDQNGDPDLSGILTFFLPEHTNDRVSAQIGLFSVYLSDHPSEIVVDHETYLRAVESHTGTTILEKLVIPASAKQDLLHSLERVGIDARVIYPDLQGLGIYLNLWQRQLVEEIG
jgi:FRG domain